MNGFKNRGLIVVTVIVLIIVCIAVAGYIKFTNHAKQEFETIEPKTYAIKQALNNRELKAILGNDIAVDSMNYRPKQQGQLELKLGSDGIDFSANAVELEIPLIGPLGKAWLIVVADKEDDIWIYETIEVRPENTETVIKLN